MRMRNCGKRRAGVSFVTLNLPPRPEAPRRGLEGRSSMRGLGEALWSILRDAKHCFAPQDEVHDARLRLTPLNEGGDLGASQRGRGHALIAPLSLAVLIALLPVPAALADASAPVVSPDRIEDAPSIKPDPYPDFDNFAWRAFIALNWPSLTDSAHRGEPDRAKTLGDSGPRVWETFKARYELFQVGPDGRPTAPKSWGTYEAANPCGADVDNRAKTLATFTPFMDFNQSAFLPGIGANPLVAQNRTYTRYEGRLNEPEYSALAVHGWSLGESLPDPAHPDPDEGPAARALGHVRACRQRASGWRGRGARARRQGRRRALFLFRRCEAQARPLADARAARHFAGQHESSAQARANAHAGDPPPPDPWPNHGAEPGLLGVAGDQGDRVGALHAG